MVREILCQPEASLTRIEVLDGCGTLGIMDVKGTILEHAPGLVGRQTRLTPNHGNHQFLGFSHDSNKGTG